MVKTLSIAEQKETNHVNTILSQLREKTNSIHQSTEALPLMRRLGQGLATATDYANFLSTLLLIYSDLEENLQRNERLNEVLPDLEERRKIPALTSDLSELALRGFHGRTSNLGRYAKHFAPARTCLPSALGCLYVVEGSSLGGLVLLKSLSELLQSLDQKCASFLRGYGSQTQSKWKGFCNTLNSTPFDSGEEVLLLDRAVEMFELINSELKEFE